MAPHLRHPGPDELRRRPPLGLLPRRRPRPHQPRPRDLAPLPDDLEGLLGGHGGLPALLGRGHEDGRLPGEDDLGGGVGGGGVRRGGG